MTAGGQKVFHALVIVVCLGTIVWTEQQPGKQHHMQFRRFDRHPILMVAGIVGFLFEAVAAWSLMAQDHPTQKKAHVALQTVAVLLILADLYELWAVDRLNLSTHAVVGYTACFLVVMQYLCGLALLTRGTRRRTRAVVLPWHRVAGHGLVVMATVSVVLGCMYRQELDAEYASKHPHTDADDHLISGDMWATLISCATIGLAIMLLAAGNERNKMRSLSQSTGREVADMSRA